MSEAKNNSFPTYQGLVIAQCEECGVYTTFYSEKEIHTFKCRKCKTIRPLTGEPALVISNCECGKRIRGVTNSNEFMFQFDCRCGYPNTVEYSKKKHTYYGILNR